MDRRAILVPLQHAIDAMLGSDFQILNNHEEIEAVRKVSKGSSRRIV
jgi:hypothetical protein